MPMMTMARLLSQSPDGKSWRLREPYTLHDSEAHRGSVEQTVPTSCGCSHVNRRRMSLQNAWIWPTTDRVEKRPKNTRSSTKAAVKSAANNVGLGVH
jgi:hypothetical protein